MRVFVSGATGLIGRRLVELLLQAGHEVAAHARTEESAKPLRDAGVAVAIADVYDAEMLRAAVGMSQPEVVMHQLTALPRRFDREQIAEQLAENDRIRVEGTRNLVEAAQAAGARRVIAQSIAFTCTPDGDRVKDEDAPLYLDAPAPFGATVAAAAELERQVTSADGIQGVVLRYGRLLGPGTGFDPDGGQTIDAIRAGAMPLVDGARGVWSFTHVDDAADAALAALDAPPGIYNAVDDEPVETREWLPELARALGAPEPESISRDEGLERLGFTQVHWIADQRGASNRRARERFGWRPRHESWRELVKKM
jgi:nucleoside-diphosphate-sugar epimerase